MAAPTTTLVEQLAARAGPGAAVRAGGDPVDGVQPRFAAAPASREALAETLAWAASEQLRVRVSGGGTKQDWGAPGDTVDLLLSTAALCDVVEHRHGDLTTTVEAGATLASVNAALAAHGQRLPWDPPWPEQATIGGIVATNDSGPRRHGHGTPRDSIIGVTMARVDGRVAKAGGIVVKNVAGYDLSRLLTGSFGCLGVILTATFKLAPDPPASRTVEVTVDSLEAAAPIAAELAGSPLTPTAIELSWAPARLLVRFESVEASVAQQAEAARAIVGTRADAVVRSGGDEKETWRRHAAHWSSGGTLVKLSTVPAELFPTLVRVRDRAATDGLEMAVAGRAGLGVVDVRLDGPLDAQARLVGDLRERLPIGRGSAVIRRGGPALRRSVDAWGPIGDGMRVMTAIKRQFDPDGLLNTGRGPGGL
jgi:glycolate oxidase FAD binding subunit